MPKDQPLGNAPSQDALYESKMNTEDKTGEPRNTNNFVMSCSICSKEIVDVVKWEEFGVDVEEAVREMRFRIEQKTGLTASAGIFFYLFSYKVHRNKVSVHVH